MMWLKLLIGSIWEKWLGYQERKANTETERLRIRSLREQNAQNRATELAIARSKDQAGLLQAFARYKVFWIPWLIAAVPTASWFALGMLDSMFNGALPDVAKLPPQLEKYADIVFQNIFWTGGAGVGATAIDNGARAIATAIMERRK